MHDRFWMLKLASSLSVIAILVKANRCIAITLFAQYTFHHSGLLSHVSIRVWRCFMWPFRTSIPPPVGDLPRNKMGSHRGQGTHNLSSPKILPAWTPTVGSCPFLCHHLLLPPSKHTVALPNEETTRPFKDSK